MPNPPFTVKAIFEYSSDHDDDLTFPIGQIMTVTAVEDDEWYNGEYTDDSGTRREGIFPKNFVEKFEPPAPPRPARSSRPKKEPEVTSPSEPTAVETPPVVESKPQPEAGILEEKPTTEQYETPPSQPAAPISTSPPTSTEPAQKPASKPPPPEKPASSSFRDRIAAFNKPTAPPIAPVKPPGWNAQNATFIKKPFVAPPPSKDSYVPAPREPPPKVYKREEDPEVQERVAREPPVSENQPNLNEAAAQGDEEQPKPTSLKERIALLQKQQMEQAARHAEAAQKKEKPKKPVKKPAESHERTQTEGSDLERKQSADVSRDHVAETARTVTSPPLPSHEAVSDANDADYSAAADTEDAEASVASKEEYDAGSRKEHQKKPQTPETKQNEEDNEPAGEEGGEEEGAEEEEEEEVDPEVKRKMELRERMAKMSGGMGMMGFFGPPGGMPLPGAGARKPKPPAEPQREKSDDNEKATPAAAPPVPIMALPGMNARRPSEQVAPQESVEKEEEEPQAPSVTEQHSPEEVSDIEETVHDEPPRRGSLDRPPIPPPHSSSATSVPPPLPVETRPVPPPVPSEQYPSSPPVPPTRSIPPPAVKPSDTGEDSDDELSGNAKNMSLDTIADAVPSSGARPPLDRIDTGQSSVYDTSSPRSPPLGLERRTSRVPPPIPSSPPLQSPPLHSRPPPPIPGDLRRRSTTGSRSSGASAPRQAGEAEGEITEYDGDYDTDIASGAKYKDALKAHGRDSGLDEDTTTDDHAMQSPTVPESRPPPPPPHAPKTLPPAPPSQPPPKGGRASADIPRSPPSQPPKSSRVSMDVLRGPPPSNPPKSGRVSMDTPRPSFSQPPKSGRASVDVPRGPPPPLPKEQPSYNEEDEYDPFSNNASHPSVPPPPVPSGLPDPSAAAQQEAYTSSDYDDLYESSAMQARLEQASSSPRTKRFSGVPPPVPGSPPSTAPPSTPKEKRTSAMPPPPSSQLAAGRPQSSARNVRPSLDVPRGPPTVRRSMDVPRPLVDQGCIAADVDLAENTLWWTQPNTPPPVFQNRKDILLEIEQSSSRGGKTAISKEVYVLFLDYSQTVISVEYDARNPSDANLEQRQEPPPHQPRQDQLEKAHTELGARISENVNKIQNTTVADGTPFGLIQHLLAPLKHALPSIGTRAYGALVYANLANASVQQNDEIRAGDIVSFRNARFHGHRGTMHQKYNAEVGKPDHVGIVVDWDGTKKKIRAWEQGRESKKVKMESFKLNDMRSGECKVWRVMPRNWVGWDNSNH